MKKNIRYVAIFLSVGRVVPHEAEAVLHNRFGDCKDKVDADDGAARRQGHRQRGRADQPRQRLHAAEPPTLAALNHVILYLPEFDLYDDPTANSAAFGVLAPEAYDKPVVRDFGDRGESRREPRP